MCIQRLKRFTRLSSVWRGMLKSCWFYHFCFLFQFHLLFQKGLVLRTQVRIHYWHFSPTRLVLDLMSCYSELPELFHEYSFLNIDLQFLIKHTDASDWLISAPYPPPGVLHSIINKSYLIKRNIRLYIHIHKLTVRLYLSNKSRRYLWKN